MEKISHATLFTQDEDDGLEMHDIKHHGDKPGGSFELDLRSSPFQAQIKFYFDDSTLRDFIKNLKKLEESLRGKVRLGNIYEQPYVQFEGNGMGHITVSGKLVSNDHWMQKLDFNFKTDQTALGPFIKDLDVIMGHAPA